MSEDKREAVQIGVTLSTQIIAASLTMIAVVGGFVTFTVDKREVGGFYYTLVGLAFFSFVFSIFFGGKGINTARVEGSASNWDINKTKDKFNRQAILAFLGIIFFSISIFVGSEKSDELKERVDKQQVQIQKLLLQQKNYHQEIIELQKKINRYSATKESGKNQLDKKK